MEQAVERLVAIAYTVTGLSHLLAPRAWSALFVRMREQGEMAGLINALMHGPLGFLILAFHPVWRGPGLLVTLIGLALTLKALLYGARPALAQRALARADEPWRCRVAGVAAIMLGLACAWVASLPGRG